MANYFELEKLNNIIHKVIIKRILLKQKFKANEAHRAAKKIIVIAITKLLFSIKNTSA